MKRFKNYFLVAAVALCMMIALCVLPVMAAEGETTTESNYVVKEETAVETTYAPTVTETIAAIETGVYEESDKNDYVFIKVDGLSIHNPVEGDSYSVDFYCEGLPASSFYISFDMPYFVTVRSITLNQELEMAENAVWDYQIWDDGDIEVAYSSAQNFENAVLFTVEFYLPDCTINDSDYPRVYGAQFVNADAETLSMYPYPEAGIISVTTEIDILMGDANQDGKVTLEDVMCIVSYMVRGGGIDSNGKLAADIDGTGYLNMTDCQYIQNYLVGKLDSLENVNGENNGETTDPDSGDVVLPDYCTHEKMYESSRIEPTCINAGIILYQCDECGYTYKERLEITEGNHEYVEGICIYCSAPEEENGENTGEDSGEAGDSTTEVKHVYSYKDDYSYFDFYSDNTFQGTTYEYCADGSSIVTELYGTWEYNETENTVTLYDNTGNKTVFMVDENGDLYYG